MTGVEMIRKAMAMLGYTDSQGNVSGEQRFAARSLTVVNMVYADLFYLTESSGFFPLKSLSDEIQLHERVVHDIMPYGVAANLAMSESDGDQQQLFISLYNQKRTALSSIETVGDVIPCP